MTMLKWVVRILYIMILSIATMYIFGSSNYDRLTKYYEAYMEEHLNNPDVYLKGINTIMNLDYHQKLQEPVTYQSADGKHRLTMHVYAIGATVDKQLKDGLMIYFNNIHIETASGKIENPVIKIDVTLSDETYLTRDGKSSLATIIFDPNKDFPYSYVPIAFFLKANDYLYNEATKTYAEIVKIAVSYSTGVTDDKGNYLFDETYLFLGANELLAEAAYLKDDHLVFDPERYSLSALFENERPSQEEIIRFNLVTESGNLNEFNGIIWRNMILFSLIATAITYVLFFHKIFWQKIREKKETTGVVASVKSESIFKDEWDGIQFPSFFMIILHWYMAYAILIYALRSMVSTVA